jgi:3-hydroxyisobutyrate dehydrogenase
VTSSSPNGSPSGNAASEPAIAVIGLGAMGLPMAQRLLTHHQVTVFDPVRDNVLRATKAGARGASTPSEAASDANIVLLAVRTLSHVEAALFGPEGAAERLFPGSVVILTSTVGAPGAKVIAERLEELGIQLVDAPVSGGPVRAGEGDLLMMVGASKEGLDVARPVLDRLASTVVVVGSQPGDGQAMKTVNHGPRIAEALSGRSPDVLSRVDIFVKDMGIVADAGRDAGVALPVASAAEQLYRLGESAGLGACDDSTISTILSLEHHPKSTAPPS